MSDLTKLEFVRDVWEQVDQQQQLELQLAICGLSEEYELATKCTTCQLILKYGSSGLWRKEWNTFESSMNLQ